MSETLQIVGQAIYHLVQDFVHEQYLTSQFSKMRGIFVGKYIYAKIFMLNEAVFQPKPFPYYPCMVYLPTWIP